MISFKQITENNKRDIISFFTAGQSEEVAENLSEILDGIDLENDDVEFAICVTHLCAVFRIFDMGRYLFTFPCELSYDADVRGSVSEVSEYAMREEIPLVFTDVPAESLSLLSGYRHMDIDAEDAECESYRVTVKTECSLLNEVPEITLGRVELNALSELDIADYARLSKDENVNKYWGYSYSEDISNPEDSYFYENAMLEFASGISLTMAVRAFGQFAGEAVIYAFDGRGNAEFAIRLLPEWQGKGLGTEAVLALKDVAAKIGLTRLCSKVMKENISSVSMLRKVADSCDINGETADFWIYLK